jgi:tRNA 2-thiouridine synthesizing protein A
MAGFAGTRALPEKPPLVIDARGHRCPVPTLRLRRALEALAPGDQVRLLADDPMAKVDVPHFLAETGDVLVEIGDEAGSLSFLVERRGAAPRS